MDKKIKVLNLYAGIGGNRLLWDNDKIEVTAIEFDKNIAAYYKEKFPDDNVIVADAHKYLLENYKDFDFIWASPPCPSHSRIRQCAVLSNQSDAIYPEISLYQEIILLKNFAPLGCSWIVENVIPYYEPLITESKRMHRHLFWTNFNISNFEILDKRKHNDITGNQSLYGFDISSSKISDKRKSLRNMVDPNLELHIFNCALNLHKVSEQKQTNFLESI